MSGDRQALEVSEPVGPVYLHPGAQAESLGQALAGLGFTVRVLRARAHQNHPCVLVGSGPGRVVRAAGCVYAGPDQDGVWRFWLALQADPLAMEPLAPISDVSVTADAVDRALTLARAAFTQAG